MRGVIFGCIAFALPAVAQAQQQCMDFAAAQQAFQEKYGEQIAVTMTDAEGRFVFIFVNPDTGTWSIGLSPPAPALYCPISSGEDFTIHAPKPNERGG